MKYSCASCGIGFDSETSPADGICPRCQDWWSRRQIWRLEQRFEIQQLKNTYGMPTAGPPHEQGRLRSLNEARNRLEAFLGSAVSFDEEAVLEALDWWYIPYGWIGCCGFIIDKEDGHVHQLGSCHTLDDCFWAHNRGIKYDRCDLTVLRVNDLTATVNTLMKLGNRAPINPIPNKVNAKNQMTTRWRPDELGQQLGVLPVTFADHVLWFAIPALRRAAESEYFEFQVSRSRTSCST